VVLLRLFVPHTKESFVCLYVGFVGCCSSCRNWVCCWVWWREAGDFIRRIFIFYFFASAMAAYVPGACECGAVVVVKGSELVAMAAIRASASASSSRTLASSRNLLTRRAGLLLFQQAAPQGNQQQQKKLARWPLQLGAARLVSNAVSFASSSSSSSSKHHQHHRLAVASKLQFSRGSPELNFGGLGLWPRVQVRLFCPTELLSLYC